MRAGFWVCVVIAVAAVVRRLIALAYPAQSGAAQMVDLDRVFASHAVLTLAHIVPAIAFVLLAPFIVLRRGNAVFAERLLLPLGVVVGITGYAMSIDSIGGWIERSAVLFFDSLFLYCLVQSWRYRHDRDRKRRWMMRSIGILLGIATTRPVMGVFFATSALTHLGPKTFFGIAFWIGFSINTLIVELWLRSTRRPHRA